MAQDGGMADQSPDSARRKLGAAPGLCGSCVHAKLNETHRGTAYLRCTRAAWDARLPRYPRLPVTTCPGFEAQELRIFSDPHRQGNASEADGRYAMLRLLLLTRLIEPAP
jgi:hypothetical protein